MIFAIAAYLAGIAGLLLLIDRRLRAGQAAREASFLRSGFGA